MCWHQQILKRERAVLGDLAPVSKHTSTKRQKKGSRLANRRVSFAPDDQLKTMHLYTKVCTVPPGIHHSVSIS